MSSGWQSDFSYDYYKQLLIKGKSNFEIYPVCKAPKLINDCGRPKLILRHDIDICLIKALKLATIEYEFGIQSTYMVIIDSPLYSIEDTNSLDIILKLINMGHEVGLHFNPDENERIDYSDNNLSEDKMLLACNKLEETVGQPVLSISFHRPTPQFLRGPLLIYNMVNAYSKELMKWYLSDSKGQWREGPPLPRLLMPEKNLLQLLVHPIWWGEEHMLPEERLQEFFDLRTSGQSPQYTKAVDAALADTIGVRRSGSPLS